jgi:hypothetical protein
MTAFQPRNTSIDACGWPRTERAPQGALFHPFVLAYFEVLM